MKAALISRTTLLLFAGVFLVGCIPARTVTPTAVPITPVPPECSGWNCTLTGTVYLSAAEPGRELQDVTVHLTQVSYCSPTRGEQDAVSGAEGTFNFPVYLHDTDTFWFEVEVDGFESVRQSLGGFDCLYCACAPLEIVLRPAGK